MTQPRIQKMFMTEPVDRALGEVTNRQKPQTSIDPVQTFNTGNKTMPNGMPLPVVKSAPLPKPSQPTKQDQYKVEVWEPEKPAEYDPGMCYVGVDLADPRGSRLVIAVVNLGDYVGEPEEDISVEEFVAGIETLRANGASRREILETLAFEFDDLIDDVELPKFLSTSVATYTRDQVQAGVQKGLEVFRSRRDDINACNPNRPSAGLNACNPYRPSDHVAPDDDQRPIRDPRPGLDAWQAFKAKQASDHVAVDPPGAIMAHPMFRAGGL